MFLTSKTFQYICYLIIYMQKFILALSFACLMLSSSIATADKDGNQILLNNGDFKSVKLFQPICGILYCKSAVSNFFTIIGNISRQSVLPEFIISCMDETFIIQSEIEIF